MEILSIPPMEWTDRYETGVTPVDEQHKRVFKRLNELGIALNTGSSEVISKASDHLMKTILLHFEHEVCHMTNAGYASISLHNTAHDHFMKKAEEMLLQVHDGEVEVALKLYQIVSDWFFKHIQAEDSLFVPTLREYFAKSSSGKPEKKGVVQFFKDLGSTKIF